jgi:hypothetical protein
MVPPPLQLLRTGMSEGVTARVHSRTTLTREAQEDTGRLRLQDAQGHGRPHDILRSCHHNPDWFPDPEA